jgi:hypothetical protein
MEECCRNIENTFIIQYPTLSMEEKIAQIERSRAKMEREACAEALHFNTSVNPKFDRMQQLMEWVKKNASSPLLDSFSHEVAATVLLLGSINRNIARALSMVESCQETERIHLAADTEQNTAISKAQLHFAKSCTKTAKTTLERLKATARNCRMFLEFIRLNRDRIEKMHSRNSGIEQLDWWTFSAATIDLVLMADGQYLKTIIKAVNPPRNLKCPATRDALADASESAIKLACGMAVKTLKADRDRLSQNAAKLAKERSLAHVQAKDWAPNTALRLTKGGKKEKDAGNAPLPREIARWTWLPLAILLYCVYEQPWVLNAIEHLSNIPLYLHRKLTSACWTPEAKEDIAEWTSEPELLSSETTRWTWLPFAIPLHCACNQYPKWFKAAEHLCWAFLHLQRKLAVACQTLKLLGITTAEGILAVAKKAMVLRKQTCTFLSHSNTRTINALFNFRWLLENIVLFVVPLPLHGAAFRHGPHFISAPFNFIRLMLMTKEDHQEEVEWVVKRKDNCVLVALALLLVFPISSFRLPGVLSLNEAAKLNWTMNFLVDYAGVPPSGGCTGIQAISFARALHLDHHGQLGAEAPTAHATAIFPGGNYSLDLGPNSAYRGPITAVSDQLQAPSASHACYAVQGWGKSRRIKRYQQ